MLSRQYFKEVGKKNSVVGSLQKHDILFERRENENETDKCRLRFKDKKATRTDTHSARTEPSSAAASSKDAAWSSLAMLPLGLFIVIPRAVAAIL